MFEQVTFLSNRKGGNVKDIEHGVGFYARIIHHQLNRNAEKNMRTLDLTRTQFEVLHFLEYAHKKGKQVMQKDIEEAFHISNPTVSVILNRLEQKNLIERVQGENDRRVRYIKLTPRADEFSRQLGDDIRNYEKKLLEGLSPEEIEQGMNFLQKITDNLCRNSEDDPMHDHHPYPHKKGDF